MDRKDQSSWWPPRQWKWTSRPPKQFLWIGGLALALLYSIGLAFDADNWSGYIPLVLVLLFLFIRFGYRYEWTGFAEAAYPKSEKEEIRPRKTLWDWMSLLLVPAMLALLGFGLT
jgi:hypothetical protein